MSYHILAIMPSWPETTDEFQEAIDKLQLPFRFKNRENVATWRAGTDYELLGKEFLVERYFAKYDGRLKTLEANSNFEPGANLYAIDFVLHSSVGPLVCVWAMCAALSKYYNAVIYYDCFDSFYCTYDDCVRYFQENLHNIE